MPNLTSHQQFVLDKVRQGFTSDAIDGDLTGRDRELLLSPGRIHESMPQAEWNEWSQRIHHALQVAFIDDTEKVQDVDELETWRHHIFNVVHEAYMKEDDILVLENAAAHFIQNDFIGHVRRSDVRMGDLNEREKRVAESLGVPASLNSSGCLGVIMVVLLTCAYFPL